MVGPDLEVMAIEITAEMLNGVHDGKTLLICRVIVPLSSVKSTTIIGNNALLIVLDLTQHSTNTNTTSVSVQYERQAPVRISERCEIRYKTDNRLLEDYSTAGRECTTTFQVLEYSTGIIWLFTGRLESMSG